MIFAENNNDIYSEKLDRVVQKTDFNSNLKHNSQNVYSIFNSFISLNFSKKVFEVIHFIKFLTEKNIQIWDVSIYNFNQIKKKFLLKGGKQKLKRKKSLKTFNLVNSLEIGC